MRLLVNEFVLDASTILAYLLGEPGADRVASLLQNHRSSISISSVNFCEIRTRLNRKTGAVASVDEAVEPLGELVVDFNRQHADLAADLYRTTVHLGLSLGDRACLALAITRGATVWTADRAWLKLSVGIPIELIRP